MSPRRLTHTIRQIEPICRRCWAISTQTEDGHRFTAFGVTLKQAIYRAHHKAKAHGRYGYPALAACGRRDAVRKPHDQGSHGRGRGGHNRAAIDRGRARPAMSGRLQPEP